MSCKEKADSVVDQCALFSLQAGRLGCCEAMNAAA